MKFYGCLIHEIFPLSLGFSMRWHISSLHLVIWQGGRKATVRRCWVAGVSMGVHLFYVYLHPLNGTVGLINLLRDNRFRMLCTVLVKILGLSYSRSSLAPRDLAADAYFSF